jgi:hypothetical protein
MAEQIEYLGNGVWRKPDGSFYINESAAWEEKALSSEEVAHLLNAGSGIAYHMNEERA